MPHYQNFGGTYLTTFVTRNRWTLPHEAREIVLKEILRQHQGMAFLYTAVVMPDHVHIVLQPMWDGSGWCYSLARVLGAIMGRSARFINQRLGRSGSVRQKCEYVAQNPAREGLVRSADEYKWLWRVWVDDWPG